VKTWQCEQCKVSYRRERPERKAKGSFVGPKHCEVPGCKVAYHECLLADANKTPRTPVVLYLIE
jgi:hypothetical protein